MSTFGRVAVWLLAAAMLHAFAVVPFPYAAHSHWRFAAEVSPNLVAALAIAGLGAGSSRRRLCAHLGAFVLWATTLFRAVADVVPAVFFREFELADLALLASAWHLFVNTWSVPMQWLWALLGLAVAAGLHFVLARSLRIVAQPLPLRLRGWLVATAVTTVVVVLLPTTWRHPCTLGAICRHLTMAAQTWLDPESALRPLRAQLAAGRERLQQEPPDLRGLADADVHVLVLESYGAYCLRHPDLAPAMRRRWHAANQQLQARGFAIATAIARPAVFGGMSWLAHMELFAAFEVPDQRTWLHALATPSQPTLPKVFAAAGYHTVEVMPAMPHHWPQGDAFYGFAQSLTQTELGYRGFVYPFGRMPDQFALQQLWQTVIEPASRPLFTVFVSTTSHAPWAVVPPYLDDWQITADSFGGPPALTHAVDWLDLPHNPALLAAYRDSLDYALRVALEFTARLTRPSLVLLLGDHQPPIAGSIAPVDQSHDVPIHALTNRPELLARLANIGFVAGAELPSTESVPALALFAPQLLQALSAGQGR